MGHQQPDRQAVRLALTVPEAHQAVGISRSSLYLLISDGTLASFKIGKRRLIPVDALEALVRKLAAAGGLG